MELQGLTRGNRLPLDSQASCRGFDPHHPLHYFRHQITLWHNVRGLLSGYNVQKVLSIPKAAQAELDSPAVSTLSIVHKMKGGDYGQIQAQAGKARRNDRGIRETD